jgi:hypothetical protein
LHKLWSMNLHNEVSNFINLEKTVEEVFKFINILNQETIHIFIDFLIVLNKVYHKSKKTN